MNDQFTDAELEAYLDESLDSVRATEIEQAAREDQGLLERLSLINSRRDAGVHTLGEIWRRNQIGVPSIETMVDFVNGKLNGHETEYIDFRLEKLKCPFTLAIYNDLNRDQKSKELSQDRRNQLLERSARLLNPVDEED
ncbi:MAG: hypothetical protein AAF623_12475 [Planctomycetota bacterium]